MGDAAVEGISRDGLRLERGKLKQEPEYFERLLAKIRDIRSSEKVFWRKVLDIYATSADYDANEAVSQKFFATVQNKMHWRARPHGGGSGSRAGGREPAIHGTENDPAGASCGRKMRPSPRTIWPRRNWRR